MKSRYPYLVMFILFVVSNWLVNRQQQYIRSTQASAQGGPTPFISTSATNESNKLTLKQKQPKQVALPTAGRPWEANKRQLKKKHYE